MLMTAIPASVISDAGCFWKMGVQPALSGGVGVGSKAFLATERVSVQFSRAHWQANEFRCSQNAPRAPQGPFMRGYGTLKRTLVSYSVV